MWTCLAHPINEVRNEFVGLPDHHLPVITMNIKRLLDTAIADSCRH